MENENNPEVRQEKIQARVVALHGMERLNDRLDHIEAVLKDMHAMLAEHAVRNVIQAETVVLDKATVKGSSLHGKGVVIAPRQDFTATTEDEPYRRTR